MAEHKTSKHTRKLSHIYKDKEVYIWIFIYNIKQVYEYSLI